MNLVKQVISYNFKRYFNDLINEFSLTSNISNSDQITRIYFSKSCIHYKQYISDIFLYVVCY